MPEIQVFANELEKKSGIANLLDDPIVDTAYDAALNASITKLNSLVQNVATNSVLRPQALSASQDVYSLATELRTDALNRDAISSQFKSSYGLTTNFLGIKFARRLPFITVAYEIESNQYSSSNYLKSVFTANRFVSTNNGLILKSTTPSAIGYLPSEGNAEKIFDPVGLIFEAGEQNQVSDLLGSVSQLASEAPLPNKNAAYAVYNYTCAIGAASGLSAQTEAYMNSFPNALKYRQFACALPIIEWLVPKIVDFAAAKLGATNKQALKQKIVNKALKAMLSTAITTAFTPKQYLEKVIEITTAMLDEIKNLVSGNAALQYLAEKEFKKFIGKVAAGILNVLSGTGSIVMSAAEFAILSPVESFYVELGTPTWKAVVPTIAVTIDPATATVNQNQDQTFTATVTGSSNTGVTWAVNSATGTTLTPNGNTVTLRSSVAGNYSVTATSVADGSKNASSSVTVSIGGRVGMGILKQSQQRVSTH